MSAQTVDTGAEQGLRAKKKQQTREKISYQATLLFLERGFDKVTIADVAAAAEVAKMTVTNYFPRKEDLALDLGEVFVDQLGRTVRERVAGSPRSPRCGAPTWRRSPIGIRSSDSPVRNSPG